ncbi:uncharacterized protein LOC125068008 [Vanessa atalanta]|uniref:uncharacterized protein LOC125068008 n=1 Tax=Vanessa atalanta TaxID=42275 RepID=UPI001FCDB446|nr:uncharacterized protein LOC125068008 [Vanessa atalanta]
MLYSKVLSYVRSGSTELFDWSKCGESYLSTVPTILWALGSAALAHRLISAMFRRFMFRRIPLWEIVLQNLLFIWMVIYSLHFWFVVTNITKFLVRYCYETNDGSVPINEVESCQMMQQWMIWMCSTVPLVFYVYTRPKSVAPPLMIWITTNPWHRREMGAYGYYLNRPFSYLNPPSNESLCQRALSLRRAFSDSRTVIKEPPRKRRNSKSV